MDVAVNERCEETEKFISNLKNDFPRVFFEGLGQSTKTKVSLELKDNIRPVFKEIRNISSSALDAVNQELERLEKLTELQL